MVAAFSQTEFGEVATKQGGSPQGDAAGEGHQTDSNPNRNLEGDGPQGHHDDDDLRGHRKTTHTGAGRQTR